MFVEGSAGRVFVEGSAGRVFVEVFTRNSWQTAIARLEAGAAEPTESNRKAKYHLSLYQSLSRSTIPCICLPARLSDSDCFCLLTP